VAQDKRFKRLLVAVLHAMHEGVVVLQTGPSLRRARVYMIILAGESKKLHHEAKNLYGKL
jgi:hypothetical protein